MLGYGASADTHYRAWTLVTGLFGYREGGAIRGGDELQVVSGTIELSHPLFERLIATARYDFNDWDITGDAVERDAWQGVLSLAWYPWPHVRWVAEYSRLETRGLMLVRDEPGHLMLAETAGVAEFGSDTLTLLLEANF